MKVIYAIILLSISLAANADAPALSNNIAVSEIDGKAPHADLGDKLNSFRDFRRKVGQNKSHVVSEGVLCRESETKWKPKLHSKQELERWPLEPGADCFTPLREFSKKLSFARAPLALSFATFIDGLEKHLGNGALNWKSCVSGCYSREKMSSSCIEATTLLSRSTHIPSGNDLYVLNKAVWEDVSTNQPLVCAAVVVDFWLSKHVIEPQERVKMVSDFFSAKFHSNSEEKNQCFDPTASVEPFERFEGSIQNILLRVPSHRE